jgi:hypothetical protein
MPFDAEAPSTRAAQLFCGIAGAADDLGLAIATAADPDPMWAERHPERLLAFLYVSPRPCAALDALLSQ